MASSFNSPRAPTNVGRPGDPHQPASEDAEGAQTKEKFGRPVPGSIPTIVRSFKSSVTTRVNSASDHPPAPFWQHNYYEHVIRDQAELNRIRDYIENNPARWEADRLYPTDSSSLFTS